MSESAPKHVPAWKKLGLKLKNAKDEQLEPQTQRKASSESLLGGQKRKSNAESDYEEPSPAPTRPAKRSKKSKSTLLDTDGTSSVTLPTDSVLHSPPLPMKPSSQKRKSVSFAPDSKAEDGDSVKQIYKTWLTSQQATDPEFDASKLSPALKHVNPAVVKTSPEGASTTATARSSSTSERPTTPKTRKKKKKSKTILKTRQIPKASSSSTTDANPEYVHPSLDYLNTHHTSPSTWKFNKVHQNYLLKHLFHLPQVPSTYNLALASYLKGLESQNTRARIRREALEVREEDRKWLESTEPETSAHNQKVDDGDQNMGLERETFEQRLARRLNDYIGAVDRMKLGLQEKEEDREEAEWRLNGGEKLWDGRLLQRQRAEVVLWGVGEVGERVMQALETATQNLPRPIKVLEQQPEFRKQMGPKRIVFGDDGDFRSNVASINGPASGINPANIAKQAAAAARSANDEQKKKRKRKRTAKDRLGAIPDDETSSSDSHDDSSDDEETKRAQARKKELQERLAAQKRELERARREVDEVLSDESSSSSEEGEESSDGTSGASGS